MFGQGFNLGFFGEPPCFTDTTDIFKDKSGVALYTLDYDASDAGGATGNFNEGVVLNGSNNVTIPGSILGDFYSASTHAISVSSWVYFAGPTSETYAHLISAGYNQAGKAFWLGMYYSGNTVSNELYLGNPGTSTTWTGFSMPTNQWTHIVITYSGTTVKLYINKTLNTTRTTSTLDWRSSGNAFKLGEYYYNTNYKLKGTFDQTRIFNRAITQAEVNTLNGETDATTNTLQILGDSSCKAAYTFDGNLNDLSGNYNATSSGVFKYNGVSSNVDFGVGGKSLYGAGFNGSNSSITLPVGLGSSGNRSRSFWVNVDNLDNAVTIFYLGNSSSNAYYETCSVQTNGKIRYQERHDTSTNSVSIDSSSSIAAGIWYNVVYVFSGSVRTLYINGVQEAQTTSSYATVNNIAYPGFIGSFRAAITNTEGKIDQVRLFNKALSSSEISKLYGNGAGEIACEHTATTTDVNYPVTNLAYYKLDNSSKDSGKSRGKFNQGVTFIGNSAGIVNTTLQLSSTAHSVSLWMKPQDLTATKWQIMFFSAFNGHPSFTLGKRPDKTTAFHYRNESSQEVYFTLSNANTWYHVVVTRNNSGSTVYVNGSSVATDSNSMGTYSSSAYDKASIGSNPLYPAEYFDGTLDQIRVYNVALTATDVANLYNNETTTTAGTLSFPTGKTAIATYKLDGDGVDISGNYSGSEGTNIVYGYDGSDTNVEYTFGKYGQAAAFNGSSSRITLHNTAFKLTTYTISHWIYSTNYNQSGVGTYDGGLDQTGGSWKGFSIIVNSNKISSYGGSNGGFYTGPNSTTTLVNGVWYHVAFVIDGTSIKGYINGVHDPALNKTLTVAMQYSSTSTNVFHFGVRSGNFGSYGYFNGFIDQARIFSSALSSDQITQLYNEKPETDTSNFKAVLYEGNGAARYISNVGFEPSLTWFKARTVTNYDHGLFDVLRGNGENYISSNLTSEERIPSSNHNYGYVSSYDVNGVFLGQGGNSNHPWAVTNKSNVDYVAWNWKGSGFQPSQTFSNIKTQGLIAHWNATQTDSLYPGSTWYDLTSNNNDLTHYKTSVANISISTNNGGAINMSSTRQFYRSQFVNDQTFTVGGWFRKDANNGNNATLWSQGYSPSFRLQIYGGSTGDRIYHYLHNGSTGNSYDTGIDVPKSAWFHIMVTYDLSNGTVKLYLNGALAHTASTITGTFYSGSNSDQYFRVIRNSTNANGYLTGAVSQIRVYSDVLTAAEVLNDYNATKNLFQTNNNGTISATVDANQDAGFSIVKYTGNLSAATTSTGQSVGHGLDNAPELIIFKSTSNSTDWNVFSSELDNWSTRLELNDTVAKNNLYSQYPIADPTSSVFYTNYLSAVNVNNYNYIAYCFHSVAGYSKIGSYSGSGVSGKEVALDFNPSFVLIKRTNGTAGWVIVDDKRGTKELYPHVANQEDTSTTNIALGTNKFTLNSTGSWYNASGGTYLYMAFK